MNRGEKAKVIIKGRFAYGLEPPPEYGLSAMAEVHFTLFIRNYEKVFFYTNICLNSLSSIPILFLNQYFVISDKSDLGTIG
jgi:hypothetical protein